MNRIAILNELQEEEDNSQAPADETNKWANDNSASPVGLSHRNMTDPYDKR
jgi:hypothetical protein